MRHILALLTLLFSTSCAAATVGIVENVEKCEMQWQIRLEPHRERATEAEGWPEQLILDANQGGDFKMAQKYMERYGWFAAATENPNDLTLYFMPNTTPLSSYDTRIRRPVIAIPSEGLKRACYAAWISGVPFVRVTKRGADPTTVIYSVTTDSIPIRDF